MGKENNIYSYKAPKSMDYEFHYLLTKGRISIRTFLIRFGIILSTEIILLVIYNLYALGRYKYWEITGGGVIRNEVFLTTFNIYKNICILYMPLICIVILMIQGAKRIHDTNHSGLFLFIPIYNIILMFSKGSVGDNDFGIDPNPLKVVKYFDELPNS